MPLGTVENQAAVSTVAKFRFFARLRASGRYATPYGVVEGEFIGLGFVRVRGAVAATQE